MSKNGNLAAARKAKNDEFYTLLTDIEDELCHYRYQLRGKVVYCNCDDPERSSFWQYFDREFDDIGLKGLIATHYAPGGRTYRLEVRRDGVTGRRLPPVRTELEGDGDFRSDGCVETLKRCDVVVTNPPFSLFREYIAQLVAHDKKFIVIGSMNAIPCREIFPLLKDGRMWLGYTHPKRFLQPDGSVRPFGNMLWYTNIDIAKRHEPLALTCRYADDPGRYPAYDNYEAIECPRVADIPGDYPGVIGVPITFLDRHCPEQFAIEGLAAGNSRATGLHYGVPYVKHDVDRGGCGVVAGRRVYARILVRRK